ncbi:MAG: RecX family transcriptional regulator [Bacteroidales bacterium]|nr:RecX family transcriptional regulator [Bacteroidales bacterium]
MTYEQALNRAASYCSKAERAPQEVREKLQAWEVSESETDRILQWLKDEHFLSEERFVHAFVNDKFTYDRWGRIKITYALRQKGLSGALVQNTLDDVIDEEKYVETLTDLLRGKMRGMTKPIGPKDRAKLYRFAASRGFETGVCAQALQRLQVSDCDEE